MRRLFGWLAGLAGIAALARLLARREHAGPLPPPLPPSQLDPAAELRDKLAEQRADAPAESAAPEDDEPRETLEERRARIHAKATQAIEELEERES